MKYNQEKIQGYIAEYCIWYICIRLYCTPTGSLIDKKTYIFQLIEKSVKPAKLPVPQLSHNIERIPTMHLTVLKMAGICNTSHYKTLLEQPLSLAKARWYLMFAQVTGVCVPWKTKIQTLHFFLERVCALTYLFDRQQLELCGRIFHAG